MNKYDRIACISINDKTVYMCYSYMYHVERDDLQLISKHDESTPIYQEILVYLCQTGVGIPRNPGILVTQYK